MAKKARQAYQYEAPVTPSNWTGEEQRFSIRVKAVLEDLYQKFSSLSGKDASIGGKTWEERLLDIYPVGSIYLSVSSTSPASLFGGTWEQIEARFLLGAGSAYTAGATGGESEHTLTIDEMPSHNHNITFYNDDFNNMGDGETSLDRMKASAGLTYDVAYMQAAWHKTTEYTGGSDAHNNMPPYLAVYMWKRVA